MLKKLSATNWIGIYDDKPTDDDIIESNMVGKHVKTSPHEYAELKGYDYLCFFDSKLRNVSETFVESSIVTYFIQQDYALLLRQHWFINMRVWKEYDVSMHQHRYRLESEKYKRYIHNQIASGLSEVVDQHCACNFLIRNMQHSKIRDINNSWYEHIKECGIQDQISFFFVKQLYNDYIRPFTDCPYSY